MASSAWISTKFEFKPSIGIQADLQVVALREIL